LTLTPLLQFPLALSHKYPRFKQRHCTMVVVQVQFHNEVFPLVFITFPLPPCCHFCSEVRHLPPYLPESIPLHLAGKCTRRSPKLMAHLPHPPRACPPPLVARSGKEGSIWQHLSRFGLSLLDVVPSPHDISHG